MTFLELSALIIGIVAGYIIGDMTFLELSAFIIGIVVGYIIGEMYKNRK